jgi:hypothetical protein
VVQAAVCSRWHQPGLEHRTLGQIDAISTDEIQYAKGFPRFLGGFKNTTA